MQPPQRQREGLPVKREARIGGKAFSFPSHPLPTRKLTNAKLENRALPMSPPSAVGLASSCSAMGRTVCSRPQAPQAHRSEVHSPPARQQIFTTTLTFDVTTRN